MSTLRDLGSSITRPRSWFLGVLCALSIACSRGDDSGAGARQELRVSAAASLRDALNSMTAEYEAASSKHLVLNFGSSGDLAKQIVAADTADVFLSADALEIDRVEREGRVVAGTRFDLCSNQLVVIEPKESARGSRFHEPFAVEQLAADSIVGLALAEPKSVPAGRYAKQWLTERGVWERLEARVVPGVDVRAACAMVESGAVDAGIVYSTDATVRERVRVVYRVPLAEGPRIVYVAAAIAGAHDLAAARAFLEHLRGETGQRTLEKFGFLAVTPTIGR